MPDLCPLRVPRLDLVPIGHGEARWTIVLEASVEFDFRGVPWLRGGQRARGETAVDVQRRTLAMLDLRDDKTPLRIDGGVDLDISRAGYLGRRDLYKAVRHQAEIIVRAGDLARITGVREVAFDNDAIGRIDEHCAPHNSAHVYLGLPVSYKIDRSGSDGLPRLRRAGLQRLHCAGPVGIKDQACVAREQAHI